MHEKFDTVVSQGEVRNNPSSINNEIAVVVDIQILLLHPFTQPIRTREYADTRIVIPPPRVRNKTYGVAWTASFTVIATT